VALVAHRSPRLTRSAVRRQLLLSLDGPIAPLVLRSERSTSLLMPVRLG
jgi:hypothetical protein